MKEGIETSEYYYVVLAQSTGTYEKGDEVLVDGGYGYTIDDVIKNKDIIINSDIWGDDDRPKHVKVSKIFKVKETINRKIEEIC